MARRGGISLRISDWDGSMVVRVPHSGLCSCIADPVKCKAGARGTSIFSVAHCLILSKQRKWKLLSVLRSGERSQFNHEVVPSTMTISCVSVTIKLMMWPIQCQIIQLNEIRSNGTFQLLEYQQRQQPHCLAPFCCLNTAEFRETTLTLSLQTT